MTRLGGYLVRLFSVDAIALFAIVSFLLFLAQGARTFDLVTVKGQDMVTLLGQTLLSMPTLVLAFAHVCVGIGLARGLRALQESKELQIIHASRRTRALFGAIAVYVLLATAALMVIAHLVAPVTEPYFNARQSDIAAELVSKTLTPGKFIEMAPGVTLVIGSRGSDGEIGDFFADDRREGGRRTFIAETATLAADERGFVIKLHDGSIQYMTGDARYSEVRFASYDLAVDRLSGRSDAPAGATEMTTPELILASLAGEAPSRAWRTITKRFSAAIQVIAICLLVAAIAAFPSGRRRSSRVPLEMVVVFAALADRVLSDFPMVPLPGGSIGGSIAIAVAALVVILVRLRALTLPVPRTAR
jgi:lipopolysaccharide export system permease protein